MVSAKSSENVIDARADELHDILDCGADTLERLAARIEQSDTEMRLVYREAEIDEAWRWAEVGLGQALHQQQRELRAHWRVVRDDLMRIHDLVGVDSDRPAAARGLRELAAHLRARSA